MKHMQIITLAAALLVMPAAVFADEYTDLIDAAKKEHVNNPGRALELLGKAKKISPDRADAFIFTGITLYKSGRHFDAGAEFKKGVLLMKNEVEKRDIIQIIDKFTAEFKSDEEYRLFKDSYDLIEKNRSADAITKLESGLKLNPGNVRLYYELGYAYIEVKEMDKAIASLETGRKINPSNRLVLKELIFAYSDSGKSGKVQDIIREMISYFGESPQLLHELAYSYSKDNKNEQAVATLEENIKKYSSYYLSYYALGMLYFDAKKYDRSRDLLDAFVKKFRKEDMDKMKSGSSYDELIKNAKAKLDEIEKIKKPS